MGIKQKKIELSDDKGLLFVNATHRCDRHPDIIGQLHISEKHVKNIKKGENLSIALFLRHREGKEPSISIDGRQGNVLGCSIEPFVQ